MINSPITDYFNAICEFRQVHPVVKGQPLRTNDPEMITIRDALSGLKEGLQKSYKEFRDIDLTIEISLGITNVLAPYGSHSHIGQTDTG